MNCRAGALAFLALAVLTSGCAESVDGGVSSSVLNACLKVPTAQDQVFRSAEDWQAFYAEHTEGGTAPAVDFGRSVLAAHFDGEGSACAGFTLDKVESRDGKVTIDATRHTSQDPCIDVVAYPQLLVVVERRDIPFVFRIRDVAGPRPPGPPACV
jgi:hypothetical protein